MLKIGDRVELSKGRHGKVCFITDKFYVIQTKNYKECVLRVDVINNNKKD